MDALQLAREYGPAALSIMGSIVGFLLCAVWAVVLMLWRLHKQHLNNLEDHLHDLSREVKTGQQYASEIKELVLGYRTEVHLLRTTLGPLKEGMTELEEAVKAQSETLNDYVEKMGVVNGKLDSVFRFMKTAPSHLGK